MEIIQVTDQNIIVYNNLAQSYEGEFSKLTEKRPDSEGMFALDTVIGGEVTGYLLYVDDSPAGLAAVRSKEPEHHEVAEFYVVPYFRKQEYGLRFAHEIWSRHAGLWEIKQIEGAEYATRFWNSVIARIDHMEYREDRYEDPYWGRVTRQRFVI